MEILVIQIVAVVSLPVCISYLSMKALARFSQRMICIDVSASAVAHLNAFASKVMARQLRSFSLSVSVCCDSDSLPSPVSYIQGIQVVSFSQARCTLAIYELYLTLHRTSVIGSRSKTLVTYRLRDVSWYSVVCVAQVHLVDVGRIFGHLFLPNLIWHQDSPIT